MSLSRLDGLPPPYGSGSPETICQRPPLPAGLTGSIHSGCYGPRLISRDHLSPRRYGLDRCREGTCLEPSPKRKEIQPCFTSALMSQRNLVTTSLSIQKAKKQKASLWTIPVKLSKIFSNALRISLSLRKIYSLALKLREDSGKTSTPFSRTMDFVSSFLTLTTPASSGRL